MLNTVKSLLNKKYVKVALGVLAVAGAGAGVYYACKKQDFLTDEEVNAIVESANECLETGSSAWNEVKESVEF